MHTRTSVAGMGNALMDILVKIDSEDILNRLELPKGSMTLIDKEKSTQILELVRSMPKSYAPGGSAANTIRGIAALKTPATYIGSVGNDELGKMFRESIAEENVDPLLLTGTLPTGYAIGFITPDSERTFATYLGAATEISPEKLSEEMFAGHKIFHIEGYLIIDHPLILNALKLAKEAGVEVSYDMASYNVVEDNREFIRKILTEYVDIVFANEEEARAFSGKDPEQAVEDLGQYCKIAVVKTGASGSLIRMEKENYMVKAIKAKRIDTTGAGDLYAAGFLHGYLRGMLPEQCGRIGSLMGGKVIETIGTKMSKSTWDEIFRQVRQISED